MLIVYKTTQKMKAKAIKKMKQIDELKKQRGMTLLEIIIVLGIIGTIAAGVVILAQRAFDSRTVSEIVSNTNTVRIAVKDAYQRSATGYPVPNGAATLALNPTTIRTHAADQPIVASLVQLGKLSLDEARNGISNDYLNIGGALTDATQTNSKGFFIELNGLSRDQCRSIVSQVGNQWDYVEVSATSAPAGTYAVTTKPVDMSTAPTTNILRSLNANGNVSISPDAITQVCTDNTSNAVILGSR
ncbi:type IV pilus major pilin [Citrobacter meridianamericanus]|uniref:type IV pilus major pilin n=1 Tax=Citrobacter meridianamericanus TaxID=2894201 RepID=UPI00351D9C8B